MLLITVKFIVYSVAIAYPITPVLASLLIPNLIHFQSEKEQITVTGSGKYQTLSSSRLSNHSFLRCGSGTFRTIHFIAGHKSRQQMAEYFV
jgi:hypothetical protein